MKTRFAVLLSALFLAACGGGNAAVGTYKFDMSSLEAAMSAEEKAQMDKMPPEQKALMEQMKSQMKVEMELTLKADNTFTMNGTMMGQKHSSSGTYTLSGDKLTMKVLEEEGKKVDKPEERVATYKDGTITATEGGRSMVFKRK